MAPIVNGGELDFMKTYLSDFFVGPVTQGRFFSSMAGAEIIGFIGIEFHESWAIASQGMMGSVAQGPVSGLHASAQGNGLCVFDFKWTFGRHGVRFDPFQVFAGWP